MSPQAGALTPRELTPLTFCRHERYMEGPWLYV